MDSRYCAMWPIAESNRTMLAEIKANTELINRCEQRRTCWAVREDGDTLPPPSRGLYICSISTEGELKSHACYSFD